MPIVDGGQGYPGPTIVEGGGPPHGAQVNPTPADADLHIMAGIGFPLRQVTAGDDIFNLTEIL